MPTRLLLTQSLAEKTWNVDAGQRFVRDSELPGFALRITKASKSFIFEKRIHGRMRRMTLGRFGNLTAEEARVQAIRMAAEISQGAVPERLRKRRTFGELSDLYLERHLPGKRSARNDRAVLRNHLNGWRSRALSEISQQDIERLHADLGRTAAYQANRTVALLRKMFNLALDWGLFLGENPAARIRFYPEEKRQRYLLPDELPRVFEVLQHEKNEYARAAFVTAILTGARRQEVLEMKWDDLTFDRAVWRVPQASGGPAHMIPLPSQLVGLLQRLSKVEGNPYVFIGDVEGGHIVNIKRAWQRIRVKAGIADVRIQDLRRTFGAWLTASGESLALVGQVLNHRSPVTTAAYVSLKLDPIRDALERNSKRMILGGGKIGPAFAKTKAVAMEPNPLLALTAHESKIKKQDEPAR
ncbi:MAG TPA: site-specific integrase [Nitrospirales bacterium]|jgi:integrase